MLKKVVFLLVVLVDGVIADFVWRRQDPSTRANRSARGCRNRPPPPPPPNRLRRPNRQLPSLLPATSRN